MNRLDEVWTRVGRALTDWRLLGVLFVVTVAVALLVSLDAADTAKRATEDTERQTTAQNRESMVVAHGACLRGNDARRRIRAFNAETIRITFTRLLESDDEVPPETIKLLDDIATEVAVAGDSILPDVDCDKAAPLPPNMTAAERDQLPKPEPIVMPGD